MPKNSTPPAEEQNPVANDVAAVDEPTRHQFPTAQTEPGSAEYVVATEELFCYGVRAHMPGDLVPADNVERNGWGEKVRPA